MFKGPLLTWHRGFRNPFESGLQSLEERADLVTGGVWRWRGLRLSQAPQAKQHRHQQARAELGPGHPASQRERGEHERVARRAGAVPGLSKSGSGPAEQETSCYPAAAKVSSQLPGRWARAGTAWRRGAALGGVW